MHSNYKAPDRPFSQDELRDTRARNLSRLRVGSTMASHENCLHFYFAKNGGKKEARLIETSGEEPGYCSVCWKLKKTPPELRDKALALVDEYQHRFQEKPDRWTHYQCELEKNFYRWLYFEPNRRRRTRETHQQSSENDVDENDTVPEDKVDQSVSKTVGTSLTSIEVPTRRWEIAPTSAEEEGSEFSPSTQE